MQRLVANKIIITSLITFSRLNTFLGIEYFFSHFFTLSKILFIYETLPSRRTETVVEALEIFVTQKGDSWNFRLNVLSLISKHAGLFQSWTLYVAKILQTTLTKHTYGYDEPFFYVRIMLSTRITDAAVYTRFGSGIFCTYCPKRASIITFSVICNYF